MPKKNSLIHKANAIIRSNRPYLPTEWKYSIREDLVSSIEEPPRKLDLTLIFFRSIGCRFSVQGECTMCDYHIAEKTSTQQTIHFVQEALNKKNTYEILFIAPLGSMFDDSEVSPIIRNEIFELAADTSCLTFGTESRPEFLTIEAIKDFITILHDKKKQINIGLETADQWILRNSIGKSFSMGDFISASKLLLEHKIDPVANILLGAPFLTELESLISTIKSVQWAQKNGAKFCILFPSNVKRWTLQHWLWKRGLYQSPSLWTYIEVLYSLGIEGAKKVALSYFDKQLSHSVVQVPTTCEKCYFKVISKLREFQAQGDFQIIESLRKSKCTCRDKWKADITNVPSMPLYERVANNYREIALDLMGFTWWEKNKNKVIEQLLVDYDNVQVTDTTDINI